METLLQLLQCHITFSVDRIRLLLDCSKGGRGSGGGTADSSGVLLEMHARIAEIEFTEWYEKILYR